MSLETKIKVLGVSHIFVPQGAASIITVLPTASVDYRGQFVLVDGGVGGADVVYCCVRNSNGTYSWEIAVTGT